jgi:UMF1 family MFS transporter
MPVTTIANASSTQDAPGQSPRASRRQLIAWALYDCADNAFATIIQTFVFAAYFTQAVAPNTTIGTAAWGHTVSATALVVALGGPVLGAIADQMGRAKPWIVVFTGLGALAMALLWFIKPSPAYLWPAMALVVAGGISAEFALIFYNAMLPRLVPSKHVGRWSGWAWSLGYLGGLASLILALQAFVQEDSAWFALDREAAEHVRAAFPLAGGWFVLFALPLLFVTPDTPTTGKRWRAAIGDGLRQLRDTLLRARQFKDIFKFLIARMVYIDGLATLFAFGGVYAAGTFGMSAEQVLRFGIALNVTAAMGAAGFAWVDDWIGSQRTILVTLLGLILVSLVILLVESQVLFWTYGLLLGVFVGPVQAASRSFLARVAPEPMRNELFGLYALSGKATAFLGPLVVGWVTYWTDSQRLGMGMVIIFFVLGFLLMLTVPRAEGSALGRH